MGDSLETVQPAGIMHYGAAFTQKCLLMMSCSEREVTGGWKGGSQIMLMMGLEGGGVG